VILGEAIETTGIGMNLHKIRPVRDRWDRIPHPLLPVVRDCCRTRDCSHKGSETMSGTRKNLNSPEKISGHNEYGSLVYGSPYER
jgi:hypothetical protein